ncbi:hypothetical protein [Rhizosaccharibacter radicis]|uniref:Uncharacterized protein n=1 Tax=Rhizosaccharibacter radicis TaxID=2782605 RepID=A0ABT1VVU9_9PROT|nr:hypothetical protein [Acetobacteraceae bacterium KSS12]
MQTGYATIHLPGSRQTTEDAAPAAARRTRHGDHAAAPFVVPGFPEGPPGLAGAAVPAASPGTGTVQTGGATSSGATAIPGGAATTTGPGAATGGTAGAGTAVAAAGQGSAPQGAASGSAHPWSWRTILSDINPLQYIPVVGTLYRTITGDEGNDTLRFAASLGTSFALGGPLGLVLTVAERVTGIDPERIGRKLLSGLFHPHAAGAPSPETHPATNTGASTAAMPAPSAAGTSVASPSIPPTARAAGRVVRPPEGVDAVTTGRRPWSPAELAAYGIANGRDGDLAAGSVHGADVLNTLELARLHGLLPARLSTSA